jgi:hypothetical protein
MGSSARALYDFMAGFGYHAHVLRGRRLAPLDLDDACRQFQLNALFVKRGDMAGLPGSD